MKAKTRRDPFHCVKCGSDGILQTIKGLPYCLKHAEIKRGIRDDNGYKSPYEEMEEVKNG